MPAPEPASAGVFPLVLYSPRPVAGDVEGPGGLVPRRRALRRRRRGKPPVSWLPCDGRVAEGRILANSSSRGVQKVGDPPDPS